MAAHGAWVALAAAIFSGIGIGSAFATRWTFLESAPREMAALRNEMADLRIMLEGHAALSARVTTLESRMTAAERYIVGNQARNAEQDRIMQELLEYQTETICLLRALENGGFPAEECVRQSTTQRLQDLRNRIRNSTMELENNDQQ